jgi:hypothetical protein
MTMKTMVTWRTVVASVWLAGCLTGCGSSSDIAGGTGSGGSGRSAKRAPDPCSLLDPNEVQAVIGPLAGPPFRTRESSDDNQPLDTGDACVYETTDFSNIRLAVTWTDGAMALKAISLPGRILSGGPDAPGKDAVAKNLLPGGVQLAGEWDEAMSLGCCQIFALRGDTLVSFDFRGWRDDMRAAAGVLDKALVRIEHPLPIDGRAGNAAATKRAAERPAKRDACAVLSRSEVEAVVGPLLADPKPSAANATDCIYRFTQAASRESTLKDAPEGFKAFVGGLTGGKTGLVSGPVDVALTIYWTGGFRRLHDEQQVAGAATGAFAGMPGQPKRQLGKVEGPWTEAVQTSLTFTAVKKDVAISVSTEPMLSNEQVELRRRLVVAAIGRI